MNFYTLREAAAAIAAELHPHDADSRAASADRYARIIYGKLCDGDLIGRDKNDRDPIDHNRLGAIIAFHDCKISEPDLNDWLDRLGNGVQVSAAPRATDAPPNAPMSKEIANAFAPYLCNGWTGESLLRKLNDVAGDSRLDRLRTLVGDKRKLARWDAAGLAILLIERGAMMDLSAWQCIEQNYPHQLDQMGEKPEPARIAMWYSGLEVRNDTE